MQGVTGDTRRGQGIQGVTGLTKGTGGDRIYRRVQGVTRGTGDTRVTGDTGGDRG